jgi:hypothetical protein
MKRTEQESKTKSITDRVASPPSRPGPLSSQPQRPRRPWPARQPWKSSRPPLDGSAGALLRRPSSPPTSLVVLPQRELFLGMGIPTGEHRTLPNSRSYVIVVTRLYFRGEVLSPEGRGSARWGSWWAAPPAARQVKLQGYRGSKALRQDSESGVRDPVATFCAAARRLSGTGRERRAK